MKWIHLMHEFYACVDDEDYEKVSQYLWRHLHKSGYGRCDELDDISLHVFLLGEQGEGVEIDHINRAPWDNRRSNLRAVPCWQNIKNKGIPLNPPFPTQEEMDMAKRQRDVLKYGEKHAAVRSNKRRGNHKHQKNHHARRKVSDDLGNVFDSVKEAAIFYDIKSSSSISRCCGGFVRTTHGRVWRYV